MTRGTNTIRVGIAAAIVATVAVAVVVRAGSPPPARMGYSGTLSMGAAPAPDGTYIVTFALFADATSSTSLWAETHTDVNVTGGRFYAELGSVTALPADVLDGAERWLELKVGSETLAPRQRLTSVPYAIRAAMPVCRLVSMDLTPVTSPLTSKPTASLSCAADEVVMGGICAPWTSVGCYRLDNPTKFTDEQTLTCTYQPLVGSGCPGALGTASVSIRCCRM